MAINFPTSPVNGDTLVVNNITYVYDSTLGAWVIKPDAVTVIDLVVLNNVSTQGINVTSNVMSFGTAAKILANGSTTIHGSFNLAKNYTLGVSAVAASDVDCLLGNYFTKTISGATTFTFSNAPPSRAFGFVLELTNGGSAVVGWPATVRWPSATAPTLTAAGVDILVFITDDGGSNWRGLLSMGNSS